MGNLFEEIREKVDIVEVITHYLRLKKSGTSYKAVCPFHADRDPSFHVTPSKGLFYCFGCKTGGDVIKFVSLIEGLSYYEAAKLLAEKYGIKWEEKSYREEYDSHHKERELLSNILKIAEKYYIETLWSLEGKEALNYLREKRGAIKEIIEKFKLGYSGEKWNGLYQFLKKKGINPSDAQKVGLLYKNSQGEWIDWFRDRIMIPIYDVSNKIIGFAGRIFKEKSNNSDSPKYINTPETPLFKKGDLLFGFNLAKNQIRRENRVIVVEGYFDVITMHLYGIENVVAPMGTSLTYNQCMLIRRYIPEGKVLLLFDGDEAGKKAIFKANELLSQTELIAEVILLPEGDDADSFLRKHGKDSLLNLLNKEKKGITEFLIESIPKPTTEKEKVKAIRKVKELLYKVKDPLERHLYIEKASRHLEIEPEFFKMAITRLELEKTSNNLDQTKEVESKRSPISPIILEIFGSLLDQPEIAIKLTNINWFELIMDKELANILNRFINTLISNKLDIKATLTSDTILSITDGEIKEWIFKRSVNPKYNTTKEADRAITQCITKLKEYKRKREIKELQQKIIEAEQKGDVEKVKELLSAIYTLKTKGED